MSFDWRRLFWYDRITPKTGVRLFNIGIVPATVIGVVLLVFGTIEMRAADGQSSPLISVWILFTFAWWWYALWTVTFAKRPDPPRPHRPAPAQAVASRGSPRTVDDWKRERATAAHQWQVGNRGAGGQVQAAGTILPAWRDAEERVLQWLRQAGEHDAHLGRGTRDGGVDIESSRFIVQVKHWQTRASGPSVRQTYGVAVARGKQAVVVAQNGFTPDAMTFANGAGVALFSYTADGLRPVNSAAREALSGI